MSVVLIRKKSVGKIRPLLLLADPKLVALVENRKERERERRKV